MAGNRKTAEAQPAFLQIVTVGAIKHESYRVPFGIRQVSHFRDPGEIRTQLKSPASFEVATFWQTIAVKRKTLAGKSLDDAPSDEIYDEIRDAAETADVRIDGKCDVNFMEQTASNRGQSDQESTGQRANILTYPFPSP